MNSAAAYFFRGLVPAMVLAALLVTGCEQGTIGNPNDVDARPPVPDAAVVYDAPPRPDAAVVYDASPVPVPDAAVQPQSTCDELYGQALEYIYCGETPTTCLFNARTDGGNCNELCASFGGTCLQAFDNTSDPGTECLGDTTAGDDCTTNRNTEICVCSRF